MANLDDEPYCELLDFFQNFENLYIKGQRAPVKVLGLQILNFKPDFKASAFRDLRGLQSDIVTELLSGLNKKEYSIKEMQLEAVSLKHLKNVKEALLESLGEDDWEKVASR